MVEDGSVHRSNSHMDNQQQDKVDSRSSEVQHSLRLEGRADVASLSGGRQSIVFSNDGSKAEAEVEGLAGVQDRTVGVLDLGGSSLEVRSIVSEQPCENK
jgi:predicted transcriptional regulator